MCTQRNQNEFCAVMGRPSYSVGPLMKAGFMYIYNRKSGSSGKFRHRAGKLVGREDEEPSLSWIWNQGLPVSSDAV